MRHLRSISLARTRLQSSNSLSNAFRRPNLTIPNAAPTNQSTFARESTSSDRVSAIVDEISGLTLLEVADLTELLRKRLDIEEMPIMAVMMPGMGVGGRGGGRGSGGKGEVKKAEEKTAFDLKLEGFEAAAKIKIIKEVRSFTDLGLKEAKDLVEKAPVVLKKGVAKEEAERIIEKMKEVGAKVVME
ncbi:hypothetical protein Sjap_010270 [Stephania japonica]|uniref:Uncharacterized protein n=1 Tax=Stephania japonica TaxID=461633 RepID=A0AAP0JBA4_9MAGN